MTWDTEIIEESRRVAIIEALEATHNLTHAAQRLKASRRALRRACVRLGIDPAQYGCRPGRPWPAKEVNHEHHEGVRDEK
jgi:hypothetical protein